MDNGQHQFILGMQLDDFQPAVPAAPADAIGPSRLLQFLEKLLGLALPPEDVEHLRLLAYRTALETVLDRTSTAFYGDSFRADPIGTARTLLSRRDDLLEAGWAFRAPESAPRRLRTFAAVESAFREALPRYDRPLRGMADRLDRLIRRLPHTPIAIARLTLIEDRNLWSPGWKRLFLALEKAGTRFEALPPVAPAADDSDLAAFRRMASGAEGGKAKKKLKGDGSLLLLEGETDAELSAFFAALQADSGAENPAYLVPEQQSPLETQLSLHGLPPLGLSIPSASRPGQQALKLVPAFIWDPVDPYQILEFLNLAEKPLDPELSAVLARSMGRSPGLHGRNWQKRVNRFFAQLQAEGGDRNGRTVRQIRRQYRLWFERKRYPGEEAAPIEELLPLFEDLQVWARQRLDQADRPSPTLPALAEQSQRLVDLLQAHPRPALYRLELEQLIRAVYEGTPVVRHPAERGSPQVFTGPAAVAMPVERLVWWSFIDQSADPFFSPWYQEELRWLEEAGIRLQAAAERSRLALLQEKWPLQQVQRQLILVRPRKLAGSPVNPHPLHAMLQAAFEDLSPIRWSLGDQHPVSPPAWQKWSTLPRREESACQPHQRPAAFIRLREAERLRVPETESFTTLEALLYYPYKWLFRDQLRLYASPLVSIPEERTLLGSLSHRVFEDLLLEHPDILEMDRRTVEAEVARTTNEILQQEGAVMLLYGKEPERVRFIRQLQRAAWAFCHTLRESGWRIAEVEKNLECSLSEVRIRGRLDLLLAREQERAVVDLKWGGKTYRSDLIRNRADLQLVLYSRMAGGDSGWAHTAYFIMRDATWLSRSPDTFQGVLPIVEGVDALAVQQEIWETLERSYAWRMAQIKRGQVEVRCVDTVLELDEYYGAELNELLELPQENAAFDDYGTLIGQFE